MARKVPDPDDPQQRTREAAFRAGLWLGKTDNMRGRNEGLNEREVDALQEENSSIWGGLFARGAVKSRFEEAEQRRRNR